ncbi:hypothetical protein Glove_184g23 [Diversispora epigaea]|uniref:Uncharacterized protein n=1 Tax=Diversispora epigaea TaxID=1348612 RepID=A0A397IQV4_9GLOM|nr:hypothetical protein Glove_184g23 [Diversispora epigaea]
MSFAISDDDPVHKLLTKDIRKKLCNSLVKNCERILKEVPTEDHNYKHWDVYVGKAGLSLLFMRIHERDPGFMIGTRSALVIADEFIDSALLTYTTTAKHKMTSAKKQYECGFICSAVGLYAVAAEVKNHMGDKESSHNYLELIQSQFSHACFSPNTPSELFYGRAGFLYTQKFISGLINSSKEIPTSSLIKSVFDAIVEDGIRNASITSITNFTSNFNNTEKEQQIPLFWSFNGKPYVGAAHGFAGILTILLQFPENCREYYKRIKETVDFILFNCRSSNGNWPSSLNKDNNHLIQFCHGAPGICLLACKAYEFYKEEKYLKLATETAKYVYSQGYGHKGVGLCHGISGNAYVFLSVYRLTKDLQYFQWAIEYAEVCTQWEERILNKEFRLSDRPWSFWEGLGGTVCLLSDLVNWDAEVFKGFPEFTDI